MNTNPFTKRVFRKDAPVVLVKMPDAPVEIEKYKPYLVQKPVAPDVPGSARPRKVVVEKRVPVPYVNNDDAFN